MSATTEGTRRRNVARQTTQPERDIPVTKHENKDGPGPTAFAPRTSRSPARQLIRQALFAISLCLVLFGAWNLWSTQSTTHKQWQPKPAFDFGEPGTIKIQADTEKQGAIVAVFKEAWSAYVRDAWGSDEYHPVSQTGSNLTSNGGIGYMIIDALDTMHVMGLTSEYEHARRWIADSLSFDRPGQVNAFEVTIRVLGGLLSAYYLSLDPIFLEKAIDLADRIMPIFDTPSGIPLSFIDLGERTAWPDKDNNGWSSLSEVATLQLELKYLSHLTDDYTYWRAAEKVLEVIRDASNGNTLLPIFIEPSDGQFVTYEIRFGSRGDSFYEYLLKQYLQTNKTEPVYREMYDVAISQMVSKLLKLSQTNEFTFVAELRPIFDRETRSYTWQPVPKMDELVCFLAGNLLLSVTEGPSAVDVPPDPKTWSARQKRDWVTGTQLLRTCVEIHNTTTGLPPEIVHFWKPDENETRTTADWYIKGSPINPILDARYILRPETIESLFIAYRLTGHPQYRETGWKIFQSITAHCRVPSGGYSGIKNVNATLEPHDTVAEGRNGVGHNEEGRNAPRVSVDWDDKMETFFMSETLKYLYLLFSDDTVLPFDTVIFNTEAHPFPVFNPSVRSGFS